MDRFSHDGVEGLVRGVDDPVDAGVAEGFSCFEEASGEGFLALSDVVEELDGGGDDPGCRGREVLEAGEVESVKDLVGQEVGEEEGDDVLD